MSLIKRIFSADLTRRILCLIAATYIRLVHLTGRWTVVGGHIPQDFWDRNRPFILCFWHGRILIMPYIWNRKKPLHMIASPHRDGRLISGTVSHFGIDTIFGSTNRGGAAALRAMIRTLNAGDCVGITPDGPRGPHMRVSEGVITLARIADIPIIPASCGVRRRKVLKSWDRFIVALPFSSGVFVWGEPITVPRRGGKQALEECRLEVEQALNTLTTEADQLTGHRPIEATPAGEAHPTSEVPPTGKAAPTGPGNAAS